MKRQVITYNAIEGFHYYPNAPEECSYLSAKHRHIFIIKCFWNVSHNNREIEINTIQNQIEDDLKSLYDKPCNFGTMSCEDICEKILKIYPQVTKVEVTEDGNGGASLTR